MSETVTLTRAEYDALIARIEDAEDIAALAAHRAQVERDGEEVAYRDFLPAALVDRLLDGEHPVRIWREHRGITAAALAAAAKLPPGYLSEIENRRKPGSLNAISRLAAALGVPLDIFAAVRSDED